MAISPHVKVRLSPFYLAALEMVASRHGEHEATWAGHALRAAITAELEDKGLVERAQEYYQAQLNERAEAAATALAERRGANPPTTRRRRSAS